MKCKICILGFNMIKNLNTFELEPQEFNGQSCGISDYYFDAPNFMHLFMKFWPKDITWQIWDETIVVQGLWMKIVDHMATMVGILHEYEEAP